MKFRILALFLFVVSSIGLFDCTSSAEDFGYLAISIPRETPSGEKGAGYLYYAGSYFTVGNVGFQPQFDNPGVKIEQRDSDIYLLDRKTGDRILLGTLKTYYDFNERHPKQSLPQVQLERAPTIHISFKDRIVRNIFTGIFNIDAMGSGKVFANVRRELVVKSGSTRIVLRHGVAPRISYANLTDFLLNKDGEPLPILRWDNGDITQELLAKCKKALKVWN